MFTHKRILASVLTMAFLFLFVSVQAQEDISLQLTLRQLKQYDGLEGRPAYVAVDGIIYDVTESALWKEGVHFGFKAGEDLTDAIKAESPHGLASLEKVKAVGRVYVLLTLEELKDFDGKDGRRAYVAVDGDIYDMSESRLWRGGAHNGFQAGNDLSSAIKEISPHGVIKLNNVMKIGRLLPALTLTADELAQHDGLEGRSAYAAVDGIVYDVTESPLWADGAHFGLQAGSDVSEALSQSPHGAGVLDKLPIIGRLSE